MDYAEEQASEIEALESIYYDTFTVLSNDPPSFQFDISGEGDDEEGSTVRMQFTFTPKYPEEAPIYKIVDCEGLEEDEEKLKKVRRYASTCRFMLVTADEVI